MQEVKDHIVKWIEHLATKQILLGGFSVCPYAKNAEYEIIETDGHDIDPPPWEFELIIYKLPSEFTFEVIETIAEEYNKIFPELVFLPDGNRYTEINGVQTNNDKYNLILCQYRYNLEKARQKLSDTNYYTYWDPEYLKEILES